MPSVHHGGSRLHYDICDERLSWHDGGPSVVFHHGVGACADAWRGWTPPLAGRYRLVRFDMRGHGRSRPVAGFAWSLEAMVADLDAIVGASGDAPVHLVGESIGGTVVLAYAIAHPDRVRSVTVSNGTHVGGRVENLHDWAQRMETGGMAAWSAYMMDQRFRPGVLPAAARSWFERQQASADGTSILDAIRVLVGTDLSGDLERIRAPALVMHPDDSPFIPLEMAVELKRCLPEARLHVVADARHGLPFSHATTCAGILARFLEEVDQP